MPRKKPGNEKPKAVTKKGGRRGPRKAAGQPVEAAPVSDTTASERIAQDPAKAAAFQALQVSMNQKHGPGAVMKPREQSSHVQRISSGNPAFDRILGGGYPLGRIYEIYGPESSGKTTVALQAIAAVQGDGGKAVFVDVEHALDPDYAEQLGVDLDSILISQPQSGEQALQIVEDTVRSGAVDIIVLDSVASLVTKAELEGNMGDQHVGLQARLMGQAMRKLVAAVNKSRCILIFINQLRDKVGAFGYGETTTTSGGRSLKFHASLRLEVKRVGGIKRGETVIGQEVQMHCKKNKVSPPFKKCKVDLYYPNAEPAGFCPATALLDEAVESGVVSKSGSSYSFKKNLIGAGRLKARAALLKDQKLFKAILEAHNQAEEA